MPRALHTLGRTARAVVVEVAMPECWLPVAEGDWAETGLEAWLVEFVETEGAAREVGAALAEDAD